MFFFGIFKITVGKTTRKKYLLVHFQSKVYLFIGLNFVKYCFTNIFKLAKFFLGEKYATIYMVNSVSIVLVTYMF